MNQRFGADRDDKVLSEQLATRVLTRASELDAALKVGASVAELRRAALEAGISAEAFEAALAELHDTGAQVPAANMQPVSRARGWFLAAAIALVVTLGSIMISRMVVVAPPVAAASMIEETLLLRCLAPGEAAELIRPTLRLPGNTVVSSPGNAPRAITVRGTQSQIHDVRALLQWHESGAASTCPAPGSAPAR